jgi:hypothetical protein
MLADIRKIIHDAWEFFTPPLLYLVVMALLFLYICGSGPLVAFGAQLGELLARVDTLVLTTFLDQYKLTALVPFFVLFLLAVLAYLVNRVVWGVQSLLPVHLTTWVGAVIEERVRLEPAWGPHLERYKPLSATDLIEYLIAKARTEKQEALLAGVDSWARNWQVQRSCSDSPSF